MDELNRKSVDDFKESPKQKIIVILENIRSMQNVGSVFRTADAFLIESIFLVGFTPRPPHRDIHKTALGATETVHWEYFETTTIALESIATKKYKIYAVEQVSESISLEKINDEVEDGIVLVFGNEVNGVEADTLLLCNGCVEIPQMGMKHSLNVSVATGIVLWEFTRRKLLQ
ncbi:MAG: TrmH family RNA methyltransferase [Bacteroidetes bacterium]|nr:TrmH family RNA methyltransferase [Bacteroidota bacterium]